MQSNPIHVERERELLRQRDELRFQAPNPRDFPNWDDFYAAQEEHRQKICAIDQRIASIAEVEEEEAFFDYMNAREAALVAATGSFMVDNVPSERLRAIAGSTTDNTIRLAAQIALHQRGEEWR
jgi:hypothetical protein